MNLRKLGGELVGQDSKTRYIMVLAIGDHASESALLGGTESWPPPLPPLKRPFPAALLAVH